MSPEDDIKLEMQMNEMISLIERAMIATKWADWATDPVLVDYIGGPLPSTEERATMIARFDELWTATDEIDFNTAKKFQLGYLIEPLTLLAFVILYVPPAMHGMSPRLDGYLWELFLDRDDLDMSTINGHETIMLIRNLNDEHAITVMMRPSFNVNAVDYHLRDPLIGLLIMDNRCKLVDMLAKNRPDLVINRRHECWFAISDDPDDDDESVHVHVSMVAAVLTTEDRHDGNYEEMRKAEQSLVSVLGHPDTDIRDAMINPTCVNVFGMRQLLQHETVDMHKIRWDSPRWESYKFGKEDDDDFDKKKCKENGKGSSVKRRMTM